MFEMIGVAMMLVDATSTACFQTMVDEKKDTSLCPCYLIARELSIKGMLSEKSNHFSIVKTVGHPPLFSCFSQRDWGLLLCSDFFLFRLFLNGSVSTV